MSIKKIVALFVAMILGLGVLSACSFSDDSASDPAYTTLRYEGGDTGGSKFKEIVEPGEKIATNDRLYSYPNTQRQIKWDSSNFEKGANSADYTDMELTSKGGVGVSAKVTVPFTLNTSTAPVEVDGKEYPGGTIQVFHEIWGKSRKAYFDTTSDGNASYGAGWLWMMDTFPATCTSQILNPEVRAQDPEALWLDDSVRKGLVSGDGEGTSLKDKIQACVDNAMETDLQFYIIGNPTIDNLTPDSQFVNIYRERQDAETRAETADLNKAAKVKEAEANAAVAKAEAEIKKAEIAGYGGFDNYKCIYLADHGLNCAQPQYVVGGTK